MNPFEQLLNTPSTHPVDAEVLEMLGRQASQLFQTRGIPLNQAIRQVVANHPELGNEHIKRIVEFANTVTFQEMFQASEDKNIHFDVADPGVVLRDLKDGGSPAHDGKPLGRSMNDYATSPMKQQAGFAEIDQMLGHQFGAEAAGEMPKVASELDHSLHANPMDDLHDLKIKTEATRDALVQSYEMSYNMLKAAHTDLYKKVRVEVLDPDGAGLGGVVGVIEKVAGEHAWSIMQPIINYLVESGIAQEDLSDSLEKTAGQHVNIEHPLVASTVALVKIAEDMATTELAIDDLEKSLREIDKFYKEAGALTTGIKKAVHTRGKVPSGLRQRFPRE